MTPDESITAAIRRYRDVAVGTVPMPPEGYEIAQTDVVVRLRRKTINSALTN